MNDRRYDDGAPSGAGLPVAMGFVLGALVGAGIALLLAPGTGKEIRRGLADTGERWGEAARGKFDQAREAARGKFDEARDTAHDLKQDAKAALKAGREAFENGQRSHEPRPASRNERKG